MQRVCVYCAATPGARPEYARLARRTGEALARRGLGLVYGGGRVGLMGVLADAALEAGGEVIGVIPEALLEWEVAHSGLSELRVVASMHERKALMAELADGFIALPGGLGTLEELCEVLTWSQLGLLSKPCGLLDVNDYFGPLRAMLDRSVEERFLLPVHREMILESECPDTLLDLLARHRPPRAEKWIRRLLEP